MKKLLTSPTVWSLAVLVGALSGGAVFYFTSKPVVPPKNTAKSSAPGAKLAPPAGEPFFQSKSLSDWVDDVGGEDQAAHERARAAIKFLNKQAVPFLVQILQEPGYPGKHRADAASSLVYVITKDSPEVQALVDALKDKEKLVRASATTALGRLNVEANVLLPLSVEMLKDSSLAVRRRAAVNLGLLGSAAKEALPALEVATQDENDAVRKAAAEAIKKINSPSAKKAKSAE